MPKYGQKSTFDRKGLESPLFNQNDCTQRSLNSTRRVCTAPHVALENTIGPHTTTQRPLKNNNNKPIFHLDVGFIGAPMKPTSR